LAERRREVAEDRARRNVSRLVRFLIALGILGALVWIFLSPLLSVKEVITTGVAVSSTHGALVDQGVLAGTPLILIRTEQVAADLERDPWVRSASVEIDWPDRVVVRVEERAPVAWVETAEGWQRRAVDGVGLPSAPDPDESLPWARFNDLSGPDAESTSQVLGALEFAASLAAELRSGTTIWVEGTGELWAEVSGYPVRLGRPVEMEAKALSLAALLREGPARGSILTLIAPTHPAISPPDTEREPAEEQP